MAKFWLGKPITLTISNKKPSNTGISLINVRSANLAPSNNAADSLALGYSFSDSSQISNIVEGGGDSQVTVYGYLSSGKYASASAYSSVLWNGRHQGHNSDITLRSNETFTGFELYRQASSATLTYTAESIWLSNGTATVSLDVDSNSYTAISAVKDTLCSMTAGATTGHKSVSVSHSSISQSSHVKTANNLHYVTVSATITGNNSNLYNSEYAASSDLTASKDIQVKNDVTSVVLTNGEGSVYCKKGDTIRQNITLNTNISYQIIPIWSGTTLTYNTDNASDGTCTAADIGGQSSYLTFVTSTPGIHTITLTASGGASNKTKSFTLYVNTDAAVFDNVYDFNTGDNIIMTIPATWGGKIKINTGTASDEQSTDVYINDVNSVYTADYSTSSRTVCIHVKSAGTYNVWIQELIGTGSYSDWVLADTRPSTTGTDLDGTFNVEDITMSLS